MRPRLPLLLVHLAALLAAPMLWAQEAITVPQWQSRFADRGDD